MSDIVHGRSAYNHLKCPCPVCKKANRDYHAVLRARLRARGLPEGDPRHGTTNGYSNYGCRCAACGRANYEALAAWVARQR